MLTFKDGKGYVPIAIIKGGKSNGKIIYLKDPTDIPEDTPSDSDSDSDRDSDSGSDDDSDSEEDIPYDYPKLLNSDMFRKMGKRQRAREYDRIYRLMKRRKKPRKKDPVYENARTIKKQTTGKEFTLPVGRGQLLPIPNPNRMSTNLFTAGPNGSGKSTIISLWMKQYRKLNPKNKIYVVKRDSEDDPAFKGIRFRDISPDELLEEPIELEEIRNSLVVFDDTARISDKKVNQAVKAFMLDVLENGRKKGISVAVSNHLLADSGNTKTQLFECDILVVFPGSSNAQIKYVARAHVGMDKDQINRMLRLNSRWVLISKSRPQYVLYNKGIFIV